MCLPHPHSLLELLRLTMRRINTRERERKIYIRIEREMDGGMHNACRADLRVYTSGKTPFHSLPPRGHQTAEIMTMCSCYMPMSGKEPKRTRRGRMRPTFFFLHIPHLTLVLFFFFCVFSHPFSEGERDFFFFWFACLGKKKRNQSGGQPVPRKMWRGGANKKMFVSGWAGSGALFPK